MPCFLGLYFTLAAGRRYHCQRHAIDFVLVLGLVLAERRVSFEQFVEHASEAEPIGARIVGRPFR